MGLWYRNAVFSATWSDVFGLSKMSSFFMFMGTFGFCDSGARFLRTLESCERSCSRVGCRVVSCLLRRFTALGFRIAKERDVMKPLQKPQANPFLNLKSQTGRHKPETNNPRPPNPKPRTLHTRSPKPNKNSRKPIEIS